MFKNQLQELAQGSFGSMPTYTSIKAGPDHASAFKASVTFNGETFESPGFFPTRKQAEQKAAEVALQAQLQRSTSPPSTPNGLLLQQTVHGDLAAERQGPSLLPTASKRPLVVVERVGERKAALQELSLKAGVPLPEYTTLKSGPDHCPRFKSSVYFDGESFESPGFSGTKTQAEQAAAEVALNALENRTAVHPLSEAPHKGSPLSKNRLQEFAVREGHSLPEYSTLRSGPEHQPIFMSRVAVAGLEFTGEGALTRKQAEKDAAFVALAALSRLKDSGARSHPSNS